ncbi:hypothetical protein ANCDUO_16355 [Ancylostoma duodenale]|uniref:Uncharacterized protein n=1 Tax=Ancylostoma duodenale TaxID=51022 RepID=A0A0C2G946_9BILA|nr:hypothetical protein ANCDUO_16355 [Ancylostoma duodenale]
MFLNTGPQLQDYPYEYSRVVYEIQNDRIFESDDFAVIVQGFMDKITDVFRTDAGGYDEKMYASNHLHLSKYGNAMLAQLLWNSLLEPVGKKSKRLTSKSIRAMRLKCPTKSDIEVYASTPNHAADLYPTFDKSKK